MLHRAHLLADALENHIHDQIQIEKRGQRRQIPDQGSRVGAVVDELPQLSAEAQKHPHVDDIEQELLSKGYRLINH